MRQRALALHRAARGKIAVVPKVPVRGREDLSLAYTPGVAEPCVEIRDDAELAYTYTARQNMVAVATDGTAVLGLGDIGPEAALPVMEGKAVLFKTFAGVDAFPICVRATTVDEFVAVITALEPSFGGVNLEDIAAPRCFEVEARLRASMNIPVFHDDQHGTAIVAAAAVLNALRVVGKRPGDVTVAVNGSGAAGIAVSRLLIDMGIADVVLCDRVGIVYEGRREGMNPYKEAIARITNRRRLTGGLAEAVRGADVFVGVSAPGVLTPAMVASMARDAVVLAMANPVPEIFPDEAAAAGARIIATGRSDYPNQINNVLAFPGVFRGALDVRAREVNEAMKVAAAHAIAGILAPDELSPEQIIPSPWDERVAPAVAAAVARAAQESGVARLQVPPEEVAARTRELVRQGWAGWQGVTLQGEML
ncbi:MAG: NAD-dependent malic enzyme [Clostridia bacterium]|nr:NAD-dependent malic enzyme [Clostridia bacterium]